MYECWLTIQGSTGKSQQGRNSSSRINYPQERKSIYDHVSRTTGAPVFKRTIPPPLEDGQTNSDRGPSTSNIQPDMSFIEITESQIVPSEKIHLEDQARLTGKAGNAGNAEDSSGIEKPFSSQVKKYEKLFSILSSHSDIDHPICAECTALLLSSFNARLASATRERDAYASFLKSLQQSASSISKIDAKATAEKDLGELIREDDALYEELVRMEKDRQALEEELADLEEESNKLQLEEQTFWAQRNTFDEELYDLVADLTSLQQKYGHDQQQLERLQRTNVYNDTFCIGHDGYFGTINGLRLGRLSNQNVEWAEINAAWGQTLLLLATVAERLAFQFRGYRLRPLGSTSRIEKLEWPQQAPEPIRIGGTNQRLNTATNPQPKVTQLDLFSSGEMAVGRIFNHRRFDAGMVAFLDCLAQVGDHVERTSAAQVEIRATSRTPSAKRVLPYRIQGDKIGDVSIKLGVGFQQDENFTKACKYALTCCKFLLAHVSNLENPRGG